MKILKFLANLISIVENMTYHIVSANCRYVIKNILVKLIRAELQKFCVLRKMSFGSLIS
jgi:hypothetical protein